MGSARLKAFFQLIVRLALVVGQTIFVDRLEQIRTGAISLEYHTREREKCGEEE